MRKTIWFVGIFLSVLLVVPLAWSFNLLDVSHFSWTSAPAPLFQSSPDSTPTVFVDPAITKDDTLQSGSYFTVHVNISDVIDLFAWQINMSWDSSILNVSQIIAGEFLMRASPTANTSSFLHPYGLGFVINVTDNAEGYTAMGESILGGVPGITGSGRLVSIEFLVTGYGNTSLAISLNGNLPTTLLNSTGATITFAEAEGSFSNLLPGDITDDTPGLPPPDAPDGDVDGFDLGAFADAYGSSLGAPEYTILADLTDDTPGIPPDAPDGDVDGFDLGVFADNYGTSV